MEQTTVDLRLLLHVEGERMTGQVEARAATTRGRSPAGSDSIGARRADRGGDRTHCRIHQWLATQEVLNDRRRTPRR